MSERRVTLCWPNRIDEAVLSGGSWSGGLPRDHLQTPVMAEVAESSDLLPSSTRFDITLPRFRTIAVAALCKHNLSVDARWRVRLFRDETASEEMWDSGWLPAWPSIYSSSELNWEDSNFWSGVPFEEDRQDFTPLAWAFADRPQVCRLVRFEIEDTNNADGVVRIGRCFVGDAWQPQYNAAYGIQYGHDIGTEFESAGNAEMTEYADVKAPKRTVTFSLDHLSEEEGVRRALALQRKQGLHGEVLYTEHKTPGPMAFSRTFMGRQVSVDPLTHPYYATYANTINLKEIL